MKEKKPEKREAWPRMKPVVNHGKPMIMVDCRIGGRGERKYFATRREAEGEQQRQRVKRANEGNSAFDFPQDVRIDATAAMKILEPYGISLRESADFYRRHAATATGDKTIQQVIDELLDVKKGAGMSPRYIQDLRLRLNIFARTFGSEKAINISQSMVDDWIIGLPHSGTTKNNYRADLSVMFNFAVDRKYVLQVPISKQSRTIVKRGKPGILTVDECARLISSCEDDILPSVALGMFAGLRPESEIRRLDWSRIDFTEKQIDIEPLATKNSGDNASVRFVDMPDNLIEWLWPHRKAKGPVWPMGSGAFYSRIEGARKDAGIETWPHDALRHSYCSYHFAKHNDQGKTMAQAGHTNPRTFFRHYRARVQSTDAERFFGIRPTVDEKVVPFTKSA
jgi:integrase